MKKPGHEVFWVQLTVKVFQPPVKNERDLIDRLRYQLQCAMEVSLLRHEKSALNDNSDLSRKAIKQGIEYE